VLVHEKKMPAIAVRDAQDDDDGQQHHEQQQQQEEEEEEATMNHFPLALVREGKRGETTG
jgi:hypothetical protein